MPFHRLLTIAILGLSLTAGTGLAQDSHKATRDKLNESTVFVAGGTIGATYNALANDIALVTTDKKTLEVEISADGRIGEVEEEIGEGK